MRTQQTQRRRRKPPSQIDNLYIVLWTAIFLLVLGLSGLVLLALWAVQSWPP